MTWWREHGDSALPRLCFCFRGSPLVGDTSSCCKPNRDSHLSLGVPCTRLYSWIKTFWDEVKYWISNHEGPVKAKGLMPVRESWLGFQFHVRCAIAGCSSVKLTAVCILYGELSSLGTLQPSGLYCTYILTAVPFGSTPTRACILYWH